MGVELGGSQRKMLAENNLLYLGVIAVLTFVILLGALTDGNKTALPKCQEDEYLFPEDYKGPGNNYPGDYKCVHVDTIRSN